MVEWEIPTSGYNAAILSEGADTICLAAPRTRTINKGGLENENATILNSVGLFGHFGI
jgi:hypothetical protein